MARFQLERQLVVKLGSGGLIRSRVGGPRVASVQPPGGPRAGRSSSCPGRLASFIQPAGRPGSLLPRNLTGEGLSVRGAPSERSGRRGGGSLRSAQERGLAGGERAAPLQRAPRGGSGDGRGGSRARRPRRRGPE